MIGSPFNLRRFAAHYSGLGAERHERIPSRPFTWTDIPVSRPVRLRCPKVSGQRLRSNRRRLSGLLRLWPETRMAVDACEASQGE